jgi:hypothetical protein
MNEFSTSTPVKIPLRERLNFRFIIFAAVMLLIVGYPVFLYLQSELTGGIQDAGNGYKQIDLKAMSSFDFDQYGGRLNDIPKQWRDLDGKKVVLYGEMWAPDSASPDLNHFELCYSRAKCCFAGPPLVQHFVKSKAMKGTVEYDGGLVKVKGILHVNVVPGGEKIASIYQLEVESVEPVM